MSELKPSEVRQFMEQKGLLPNNSTQWVKMIMNMQAEIDRLKEDNEELDKQISACGLSAKGLLFEPQQNQKSGALVAFRELYAENFSLKQRNAELVEALTTADECIQVLSMLSGVDTNDVQKIIKQALAKARGEA
ncbi:hypothetical protein [uncultured Arcobacter sp.]|uniref:hypothetical protein n=1 Tax=uncultured Arcobacter sp. TaxID=165434 RepID=UPI0026108511|nr:hypothetical protein [uncultured Arcobacter sp.]